MCTITAEIAVLNSPPPLLLMYVYPPDAKGAATSPLPSSLNYNNTFLFSRSKKELLALTSMLEKKLFLLIRESNLKIWKQLLLM